MLSKVKSMALQGLEGFCIDVEADISSGLPSWEIVGLPDASIRESKERVRTAIKNSGYELMSRKIVINLAPANLRKEGSIFDLSIAIAILYADGRIKKNNMDNKIFLGELSLDGKVNKISGVLPMCIEAVRRGINMVFLAKENAKEASIIENLIVIPVNNLKQCVDFLNGKIIIQQEKNDIKVNFINNKKYLLDFEDVKGQENVKRALEVSASGGHNCLLIGSPGSGKTMMAKRVPSILPDLDFEEALEITKIHSIAGKLSDKALIEERPFRNPHHTITPTSLVGGGRIPKPGEISLAHYGVLFLDELPEFNVRALETLRGPLEDRKISISRVNSNLTYPCNFMLIASMNPCPCGYYGTEKACRCRPESIQKYINKISGPLLDRIDIQVEVTSVSYNKINTHSNSESSEQIRQRVNLAREFQRKRYIGEGIFSNSELTPKLIEKYCALDTKGKKIISIAFEKLGLSMRAYSRILKVARTIADLELCENIQSNHLLEAVQYRSLDKKYLERKNK